MPDPNIDTALEWANELGPIPMLPKSLMDPEKKAKLVDIIDEPLIKGQLIFLLSNDEKNRRIENIGKISTEYITDIRDLSNRANICLRLWAGCIFAAKMASPSTMDGPNTHEIRKKAFEIIDAIANRDSVYRAGVEAAPKFRSQPYLTEGIPKTSPFRKYIKG